MKGQVWNFFKNIIVSYNCIFCTRWCIGDDSTNHLCDHLIWNYRNWSHDHLLNVFLCLICFTVFVFFFDPVTLNWTVNKHLVTKFSLSFSVFINQPSILFNGWSLIFFYFEKEFTIVKKDNLMIFFWRKLLQFSNLEV